ncbi:hypothetical protein [Parvibaculum sp.]|uniref:hypothetical protein n=1 Tax=Parvibaculum sp. TaxID=2024848 RepID=UPI003919E6C1
MTGMEEIEGGRRWKEELLHLYADGLIRRHPDLAATAERLIAEDAEARRMVEDIRAINRTIVETAPLSPDLPLRLREAFRPHKRPVLPRIGHAAAAVAAALVVGFFAGHLIGASSRTSIPEATITLLTERQSDPGRVAADAAMAGVQAARAVAEADRLEMGRGLPDFSGAGFTLFDVTRTLAGEGQSLVTAQYRNPESGEIVELAMMPMPQTPVPPQKGVEGGGGRIFWSDGLLAYGLKASEGQPDLGALARLASSDGNWMLTASDTSVPAAETIEAAPVTAPFPAVGAVPSASSDMPQAIEPVLPEEHRRGS